MRALGIQLIVHLLGISCFAGSAHAAEASGEAFRTCRAEADDARRLACYDRVADRASKTLAAPAAAPAATTAPAAAVTAEDNFGREHQIASEETQRKQKEARSLGNLEATVTSIETRMDGLMTLTLDNGQVWRQNTPDSKFHLKSGDRIRIQPGSMSSFILSGPSKKSTRVTRVK